MFISEIAMLISKIKTILGTLDLEIHLTNDNYGKFDATIAAIAMTLSEHLKAFLKNNDTFGDILLQQ